jgi:hypothetical protein
MPATLDIEAPPATAPEKPRPVSVDPPSIRLGRALSAGDADALPPVLAECRDVVQAARANLLPREPRDANARIYILANELYIIWSQHTEGGGAMTGEKAASVRAINQELRQWASVLRPVLSAQKALDEAMTAYQANAPRRNR